MEWPSRPDDDPIDPPTALVSVIGLEAGAPLAQVGANLAPEAVAIIVAAVSATGWAVRQYFRSRPDAIRAKTDARRQREEAKIVDHILERRDDFVFGGTLPTLHVQPKELPASTDAAPAGDVGDSGGNADPAYGLLKELLDRVEALEDQPVDITAALDPASPHQARQWNLRLRNKSAKITARQVDVRVAHNNVVHHLTLNGTLDLRPGEQGLCPWPDELGTGVEAYLLVVTWFEGENAMQSRRIPVWMPRQLPPGD